VAFAATVDGRTLLWIRALNSLSARPLAGTEGAFSPFWSPDSRSVAFFAAGQMKKIDVAGGPPQKICDVPATVGTGTWGSRGDILFSDILAARAGINRVSAQGGEIKAVTKADPSKNEGQHFWPQFLPDGKRFLYLVGVNAGSNAVFAASIDGGEPKLLMQESSHVGFAAPGYLIFAREGSLLAQRF